MAAKDYFWAVIDSEDPKGVEIDRKGRPLIFCTRVEARKALKKLPGRRIAKVAVRDYYQV